MQEDSNSIDFNKLDKKDFKLHREHIQLEQEVLRESSEMHENHFAMVENFVEKYIPVRIQSQISETLRSFLHDQMLALVDDFEENKFKELH